MSKKLKLFGLLALTLALAAGVAWASFSGTTTLNGTRTADLVVDKISAGPQVLNTFNEVTGNGKLTGAVQANVTAGNGAGAATPLVLALNADEKNTVELAPAANNRISEGTNVVGNYNVPATLGNNLQVIVNGPVDLPDNADNTNNGTVVIRGANADEPTTTAAGIRNNYWGGTFVYGGTLGVSQNNALGQGWVALMARSAASPRRGATLDINGTTKVQLGIEDPAGNATGQPVYLVADGTEALTPAARHVQQVFINVDSIGGKAQELWLNHGLREVKVYTSAQNLATGGGGAWPDQLLSWTTAQMAPMTRGQVPATPLAPAHLIQLVKTGAGVLYIGSDGTGLPAFDAVNGRYVAYRGATHEGGTIVRGGTLKIDGQNASNWKARYTGYLGSVWRLGTAPGDINAAGTTSDAGYVNNSAGGALAIHNPLYLENDAKVIVDRAQIFSFFRGAKNTEFTANQFSLNKVNERPMIFVTLNREHSDFDGKLSGSFDLVVNSKVSTLGSLAGTAVTPGQAQLRLGKAENDITGLTRVDNGVLSVAGANSIAPKGPGTLTAGTGALATTPDKAVFLAVANSTFMNPTILKGWRSNQKPANTTNITSDGALAAASDTKVSFSDVTIDGSMEINPRAVRQVIGRGVDDSIRWTDAQPYPTWTGMVAFGEGASADYSIGGSVNNVTQIAISRGTWHLGKLPKDNGTGFANVMIRQDATLSLGDGVRDFSKCLDVQVDNDSRIRLVVKPEDVAKSREAAMAKEPIFKAREIDYTWLGTGGSAKDFRLNLWVDISALDNKLTKGDWLKLVQSDNAIQWNHLHYLREYSGTRNEDKVKVVVTFCDKDGKRITDINLGDESVSTLLPLDEGSHTILVPVLQDFTGPVSEDTKPEVKTATAVITAPAEVKPGAEVTFELGKWSYKTSSDVEVIDVKWTLNGEDKTAEQKDNKLTVKDVKEGTLSLVVTGKLKSDPTVEAKAEKSVTVKKDGGTPGPDNDKKSSGGGCDAGFGALALVAGAAFLLRKKN